MVEGAASMMVRGASCGDSRKRSLSALENEAKDNPECGGSVKSGIDRRYRVHGRGNVLPISRILLGMDSFPSYLTRRI